MKPTSRLPELQTLPFGFADEILQTSQRGVLMVVRQKDLSGVGSSHPIYRGATPV